MICPKKGASTPRVPGGLEQIQRLFIVGVSIALNSRGVMKDITKLIDGAVEARARHKPTPLVEMVLPAGDPRTDRRVQQAPRG